MVYLSACEVGMPAWKSRSETPREPCFVVSKAETQGRDWRIGNKRDVSLVLWAGWGCNRAEFGHAELDSFRGSSKRARQAQTLARLELEARQIQLN
jgi:hypothetical protein